MIPVGITGLDESGRQDLNLRPLGPEISGQGSHGIVSVPVSTQAAGFLGVGKRDGSHLVSGNEPIPNGSFTIYAQDSQLNATFLTIREVAKQLRVCPATVYRMIDKGQLWNTRVSSGAIRVIVDAPGGIRLLRPVPPRRRRAPRS